jgi:hypothetical protein
MHLLPRVANHDRLVENSRVGSSPVITLLIKRTYLVTKIQPKKYISLLSSLYLTASPQARTCVFTVRSRRDV